MDVRLIAALLSLLLALLLLLLLGGYRRQQRYPYEKQASLFSKAELSFMQALEPLLGSHYRLFGKVHLADILRVRGRLSKRNTLRAWDRISTNHIDFVICEAQTLAVLCAIELDDKRHALPEHRQHNKFLEAAFREAGVPLLRQPLRHSYTSNDLLELLVPVLGNRPPLPEPLPNMPLPTLLRTCPACGAAMVKHEANVGGYFWACSRYPDCKKTLSLN